MLKNKQINLKFIIHLKKETKKDKTIYIIKTGTVFENQTLQKAFNYFLLQNNISIGTNYSFYLGNNKKREIQRNTLISELNLKNNDEIIVTNKLFNLEKQIETNFDPIETSKQTLASSAFKHKNKKILELENQPKEEIKIIQKEKLIVFFINLMLSTLFIIGLVIIIYILLKKRKKKEGYKFQKEELIIERNYPINILFRYSSTKKTEMEIDGKNFQKYNSSDALSQITDLFFIVRKNYIENDNISNTGKEWYTGYVGILNLTMRNKTHDMITIYDKTLNYYLNNNNLRRIEEVDLQYRREK